MKRTIKAIFAFALAIMTITSIAIPANATTLKGDAISTESKEENMDLVTASVSHEVYQNGKLTAETTVKIPEGWEREDVAMGQKSKDSDALENNENTSNAPEEIAEETSDEDSDKYVGVPLFDQTLYPDIPYGSGSIATGGCGIVCASMVISYMIDETVPPDTVAAEYNLPGVTNLDRMEAALSGYGVDFTKTYHWADVKAALENGQVAIIMVNQQSCFTGTQHLIVVDHINNDGTIMVKDPNGANYRRIDWYIDPMYKNGFLEEEITIGFCGGWIIETKEVLDKNPIC